MLEAGGHPRCRHPRTNRDEYGMRRSAELRELPAQFLGGIDIGDRRFDAVVQLAIEDRGMPAFGNKPVAHFFLHRQDGGTIQASRHDAPIGAQDIEQ